MSEPCLRQIVSLSLEHVETHIMARPPDITKNKPGPKSSIAKNQPGPKTTRTENKRGRITNEDQKLSETTNQPRPNASQNQNPTRTKN